LNRRAVPESVTTICGAAYHERPHMWNSYFLTVPKYFGSKVRQRILLGRGPQGLRGVEPMHEVVKVASGESPLKRAGD